MNDPRRLNVALTRAKYGVIIIGNAKVLQRQALWNELLVMYKESDTLVEGALNNLQLCVMAISRPRNPGRARFITPSMQYSGREYSAPAPAPDDFYSTRDLVSAIGMDRTALHANLPVPPALFMPMTQASQPAPRQRNKRRPREVGDAPLSQASQTQTQDMLSQFDMGLGALGGMSQDSFVADGPY